MTNLTLNIPHLFNWVARPNGAEILVYGIDPSERRLETKYNARVQCYRIVPDEKEMFLWARDHSNNTVACLRLGTLRTEP